MASPERELCTTLCAVIHRLATCDTELLEVLRRNLTHGEVEVLVQNLAEAGCKAEKLRPRGIGRAKGVAA